MSTTISPQQFQQQYNPATDTLIDVRTPMEYRGLHISGANNLPLEQLSAEQLTAQFSTQPSIQDRQRIYLICQAGKRAAMAAEKVSAQYQGELIVVDGGTDACAQLGLPCTAGKKQMSLERQVRIAAGSLVLVGIVLGLTVHSGFIGLSAFVGTGLVFAGITDSCGMAMILAKMPWNK